MDKEVNMTKNQIIEFVKDYIDNKGHIIDKYSDTPHHIAEEWQILTQLLDRIRNEMPGLE